MRVLGLDLGTSSIGWAVVDTSNGMKLIEKGVQVFPKGVGEEKNVEFSLASERTGYRSARRIKQRRKWRKQQTLRILAKHDYCPGIKEQDIDVWRYDKKYPDNEEFVSWQRVSEVDEKGEPATPYYYRALAVTQKLDLSIAENRYRLGRAFYHLAQRRGYKSNRLSGEDREGKVQEAIKKTREARKGKTLGQYLHEDCLGESQVRGQGHYTSREDYLEEFERICIFQGLPEKLVSDLKDAIFFQRPLKSQKGTVGPCLLEKGKRRAPVSHPEVEKFRALQFINNIRIRPQGQGLFRELNDLEREQCLSWLATRKKVEKFESLARQLTPKRSKRVFGEKEGDVDINLWGFNFRKDAGVPDSPTTARFISVFGEDWKEKLCERYQKSEGKSEAEVVNDIWHAVFSYDDEEKLREFVRVNLDITDPDSLTLFVQPLKQGYATMSIMAVRKITPWLEKGLIYSHAVFLANLPTLFKKSKLDWAGHASEVEGRIGQLLESHQLEASSEKAINAAIKYLREQDVRDLGMHLIVGKNRRELELRLENSCRSSLGGKSWQSLGDSLKKDLIQSCLEKIQEVYVPQPSDLTFMKIRSIQDRIEEYLKKEFKLSATALESLYHPSAIEAYPSSDEGLASPRIPSIRNPVFMRTMFRMRAIINELIEKGVVNADTKVQVEMARDLNDGNDRAAWYRYQREREKRREGYKKEIEKEGFPATESNILKYQLWEEQDHRCIYTDKQISVSAFLAENPDFDIEHTIPQSRRFDDSQSNLTLCDRQYNREVKRNKIPQELDQADEVLLRAQALYLTKITSLEEQCARSAMACKMAADKTNKDRARQTLLYHRMHLHYWKDKLRGFERTEVPDGFLNSQLVDTRIICKYAVLYLKSYFDRVYSMKATALSELKSIWGLDKKTRDNHIHHCIDAVVTASIRPSFYRDLAEYYHNRDLYAWNNGKRPHPPEPWNGFAKYLNEEIYHEVLVVHHQKDNLLKQTYRKLRKKGKPVIGVDGKPIYILGDSVRGSLHKDTYYGVIQQPPQAGDKEPGETRCVVRKILDGNFKDFDKIVDPAVKEKVLAQKEKLKNGETVWFNEQQNVPIKKVRVYDRNKPDSLVKLKEHRDASKHQHKQALYAANDGNYLIALYRGKVKGLEKADWRKLSNMEAVEASRSDTWDQVLPEVDTKGLKKVAVLKTGTLVLIGKDDQEDLKGLEKRELVERLYIVTALEGDRVQLKKHNSAKRAAELGGGNGIIPWGTHPYPEKIRFTTNKLQVKVAGTHFNLTDTGELKWLE